MWIHDILNTVRKKINEWMNELISSKGDCRKAPATSGLSNIEIASSLDKLCQIKSTAPTRVSELFCFLIWNAHCFSSSSESGFKCLKISEILVQMHTFGNNQFITPLTIRKRMQEDDAWKQTNLMILMHLSPKISLDDMWFAHRYPTSMYTQKVRQPYLF